MKKTYFVFAIFASMALVGCNGGGQTSSSPAPSSSADSSLQAESSTPGTSSILSSTASSEVSSVHVHTAGKEWHHDPTNHWHTCTGCGEVVDVAAHSFSDVVTAPTYDAGGYTTHTCTVCNYSYVDSQTNKLEKTALATPVVTFDEATSTIAWGAVEHATSYKVLDGEALVEEANTSLSIALSETIGSHSITVIANSSEEGYTESSASVAFTYETKAVAFTGLSETGGVITINGVAGYVTFYDAKGAPTALGFNKSSYQVAESGKVSFSVSKGYNKETNVYYVGDSINKSIHVVFNASEDFIIEDGSEDTNADLADKYTATKYDSGWVTTGASAVLDPSNAGTTEGNCVKLNFWNHGTWFKFTSPLEVKDGFDGVSFMLKANSTESQFSLVFTDADGNYATYKLTTVSTAWTKHNVRFDDAGWNVNGSGYTIAQVAAAKGYASAKQLAATFASYDLRVYHASDSTGGSNSMLIDDLKLVSTMSASSSETIVKPYDQYILKTTGTDSFATLTKTEENVYVFEEQVGDALSPKILTLASNIQGTTITFSSDEVTYIGSLSDDGKTITYTSATGPYADFAATLQQFIAGKVLDTFESYTETGKGFDQSNSDLTKVSGLRSQYFSDYYSGNSNATSPVGGNNWSLMGSADYVTLDTANGVGQSKAMKHKIGSNTMRVMTGGLALGNAQSQGAASKICFAIKGIASNQFTINFRSFYMKAVTPSNQQDTALTKADTLTVKTNDWQLKEVSLKTDKDFYGFAMTFKNGPSTAEYTLIDNIYIVY